jgi:hypothetical protein
MIELLADTSGADAAEFRTQLLPGPVHAGAHRSDRHSEGLRRLLVTEVASRHQQQGVPVPGGQSPQGGRQALAHGHRAHPLVRAIRERFGGRVDSGPFEGTQPPYLGALVPPDPVRRDAVQPRLQAAALAATLPLCNAAANEVSAVAFTQGVFARQKLQKLVYADVKARGLSAQPALHVIRKVADAYTTLHAHIEAGLLGDEHSRRRRKAESKPVTFRADAAQPFDDRCLSWQMDARTVSIWTRFGPGSEHRLHRRAGAAQIPGGPSQRAKPTWCAATGCSS